MIKLLNKAVRVGIGPSNFLKIFLKKTQKCSWQGAPSMVSHLVYWVNN